MDAGTAAATALNEKYNIISRATAAYEGAKGRATELDEKYKISESSITSYAMGAAQSAFEKLKSLNEKYEIVDKIKGTVNRLVVYAVEIDSKYAVRTAAARLFVSGVNAVVSSTFITPKTLPATIAVPAQVPVNDTVTSSGNAKASD